MKHGWQAYIFVFTFSFMGAAYCWAGDAKREGLCRDLAKSRKPVAILVTEDGAIVKGGLDLGSLDVKKGNWHNDYILSEKKYRLITYPKRFSFKENISQGYFFEKNKIKLKPICANTTETVISMGILPRAFGSGPFKIVEPFIVDDPSADFENQFEIEYKFNNFAYGVLQKE